MVKGFSITLGVIALLVGAVVATVGAGGYLFKQDVAERVAVMFEEIAGAAPGVVTEADAAGLPQPVRRWLSYSRVLGRPRVLSARMRQTGYYLQSETEEWLPFTAEKYFTIDPPAFVRYANIRPVPLVSVKRLDAYYRGEGEQQMRLLSWIPIVDMTGGKMDQHAMALYLSEIKWFPGAALSRYIDWQPIDANSARATITYRGTTASAVFYFNDIGQLVNIVAERYRDVGTRFVGETWSAPVRAYGEMGGVRIPVKHEERWKLRDGDLSYVRIEVADIEYNRPAMYGD